tara:strand:- start:1706 stop:2614 length:909 start_codon:yes stop_codon:yes gene_type:complete
MAKVGLVTITYNSEEVLIGFLESFIKQTYKDIILYVIDNDSKDASLSILKKYNYSNIKIIKNKKNIGVASANNQGIIEALNDNCDKILFVNNDIEFNKELVSKLVVFQHKYNCSLVSPKIMFHHTPNKIWYAGGSFQKHKGYLPIHRGINSIDTGQFNIPVKVEYAPTCCLLINKDVFTDIGLMDEKYFVYFDDTDFLYRILKKNKHHLYYSPNTTIYHKVGSLTKSLYKKENRVYRGDFFLKQMTRNHVYFLKKQNTLFSLFYIFWLFLKNNIKFIINRRIRKNIKTLLLINRAYFEGVRM